MRIPWDDVSTLVTNIFMKHNLSENDASIMSEALMDAEGRGKPAHGLVLIKSYLNEVDEKHHAPIVLRDSGAFSIVDGGDCLGPIAARFACDLAVNKAHEFGAAVIGVNNKSPFALTGTQAEYIAMNNCVGIVMCNSRARVAPMGTYSPVMGPNPIAFGMPTVNGPWTIDFATSAITMGDVRMAINNNELLPEDVAYSKNGKNTRDPKEAMEGSIRPFGGYKGYALGLAIELLAGPMVFAKAGKNFNEKRGFLMVAISLDDPDTRESMLDGIESLIREVQDAPLAEDFNTIRIPGFNSLAKKKEAMQLGLELDDEFYQELLKYTH